MAKQIADIGAKGPSLPAPVPVPVVPSGSGEFDINELNNIFANR